MAGGDGQQKAVPKWVFWTSLVLVGLLAVVVLLLTFGVLPADRFDSWRAPLIVALLVASVIAALASNEIIPWDKRRSIHTWMQPKVLGALVIMLIGVFSVLADLLSLLGPATATEEGQSRIETKVERSAADASEQLSEINRRVRDIDVGAAAGADDDPRAEIVRLTGGWSVPGFVDAVFERDADIVGKYLESGLKPTTRHKNASAILYGFQTGLNGDPVALLRTLQAHGYQLDDELADGRILQSISDSLPMPFDTELTPENYTGGYFDGKFAGPLMLWIVNRASWDGGTDEDRRVLEYLISEGADCSISRSFLEFNRDLLADTSIFETLYPIIDRCAS